MLGFAANLLLKYAHWQGIWFGIAPDWSPTQLFVGMEMESWDVGYGLIWCVWRPQVWVKEFSAWVVRYPTRRIVQQLDSIFWQFWQRRLAGWMGVSDNKSRKSMDGWGNCIGTSAAVARVMAVHGTLCGLKAAQSPTDCPTLHSAFLLSQCVADEVAEMQWEAACRCLPCWNWICDLNFLPAHANHQHDLLLADTSFSFHNSTRLL